MAEQNLIDISDKHTAFNLNVEMEATGPSKLSEDI